MDRIATEGREVTGDHDMHDLTIEDIDRTGYLLEGVDELYGSSRAEFLRTATLGGAAILLALAAPARADSLPGSDVRILNFDLRFEYLQEHFYMEGLRLGALHPDSVRWARVIGAHERAHVHIIRGVLGKAAVKSPFFDFRGVTEDDSAFARTAVAMEDLTTALLLGQLAKIKTQALVSALFSLLTVESRHAAWVRHAVGAVPVAEAVDRPKSLAEVARVVDSTHFVVSGPRMRAKSDPRFTG